MIKIKTSIRENNDGFDFSIKQYETKKTNGAEHLALIDFLIYQIEDMCHIPRKEILEFLKSNLIEEKENGK